MNSTGLLDGRLKRDILTGMKVGFVSMYAVLILGTFFGNCLVIRAFSKFSNLRTASNSILVSLAIVDLLMVVVFILQAINILLPKALHKPCILRSTLTFSFNSIIILHLALISVERFIAVQFALRYRAIVTNRRALIASMAVWLWGILFSYVFPETLKENGFKTFDEFHVALTPCFFRLYNRKKPFILHSEAVKAYLIFLLLTLLVLPIAIIVISYSYIFNVARKQRRQVMQEERNFQVVTMKREMKAARTVAIVVGLCLASFVPLLVILWLHVFTSVTISPRQLHIAYSVASMNACWNPLIYCWKNQDFRRGFKRLLKCNL